MNIDLYSISNNRLNRLCHRLDFNLNKKERKATIRMLKKEQLFFDYLESKKEKELGKIK
jgi:hypothetical protein